MGGGCQCRFRVIVSFQGIEPMQDNEISVSERNDCVLHPSQ